MDYLVFSSSSNNDKVLGIDEKQDKLDITESVENVIVYTKRAFVDSYLGQATVVESKDDQVVIDLFEGLDTALDLIILGDQDDPVPELVVAQEGEGAPAVEMPNDIDLVILSMADLKFDFLSFGVNRFEEDHKELEFSIDPLQDFSVVTDDEPIEDDDTVELAIDSRANNDSDMAIDLEDASTFTILEVTTPIVTSNVAFEVINMEANADNQEAASFSLENQVTLNTATLTVFDQGHIGIDPNGAFDGTDELQISIDYNLHYSQSGLFRVSVEIDFEDTPVARGFVFGIEGMNDDDPFLFDFMTRFGDDGLLEFAVDLILTLEELTAAEQNAQQGNNTDAPILDAEAASVIQEESTEVGELLASLDTIIAETSVLPTEG